MTQENPSFSQLSARSGTIIPVIRSSMPPFDKYVSLIKELWETRTLTNMAQNHQKLEQQLREYLLVDNFNLFVNGHMALEIALSALNMNGEVITTPFTFASTSHAIVRSGLTPVFCDIRYDDYTIDPDKIESLITKRTCAILPVHVYGLACDVRIIEQIAKKHNLKVIYDAAHAFGVTINGKGIGAFGDCSMYSFHATKVFHTIEGGGLSYSDPQFGYIINRMKDFGITSQEAVDYIGTNAKMDEFRAAMGLCNLKQIDEEFTARRMIAQHYDARLSAVHGIKLLPNQAGVTKNHAYYPIVIEDYHKTRDELFYLLRENNVITRKYFYPLVSNFASYGGRFSTSLPMAEYISNNVLCLPMHSSLTINDVDFICDIILH